MGGGIFVRRIEGRCVGANPRLSNRERIVTDALGGVFPTAPNGRV
jgi:hypothetical protein